LLLLPYTTISLSLRTKKARLSNVVEADPDVAAAMDILSFALYHENTKVVNGDDLNVVSPDLDKKRRRGEDEPDLADGSEEGADAQRRRRSDDDDVGDPSSTPAVPPPGGDAFADLKGGQRRRRRHMRERRGSCHGGTCDTIARGRRKGHEERRRGVFNRLRGWIERREVTAACCIQKIGSGSCPIL